MATLTAAVIAAALAGCGGVGETTPQGAVSSAAVEATASPAPDATASESAATGDPSQDDLQAELEAIERELDAMTLPDDADFSDIESALQ